MTRISLDVREFCCDAPGNSRIAPLISRNSNTKQQQQQRNECARADPGRKMF
jgi:hypothetical protein